MKHIKPYFSLNAFMKKLLLKKSSLNTAYFIVLIFVHITLTTVNTLKGG